MPWRRRGMATAILIPERALPPARRVNPFGRDEDGVETVPETVEDPTANVHAHLFTDRYLQPWQVGTPMDGAHRVECTHLIPHGETNDFRHEPV